MANKNNKNDFDLQELVKSDQHQKDIEELNTRIKALEEKFGTHEHIADTLSETAEKQIKMHEMIAKTFVKVLQTDRNVKKEIGVIIDAHDRKKFWWITGKIGFGVWSLFLAVVAFILGKVFA